jgi:hypothetical protein
MWAPVAIFGTLLTIASVLFARAALGASRALNRKQTCVLACVLLVLGAGGFAIVLLANGNLAHRLMVLAGSITFFLRGLPACDAEAMMHSTSFEAGGFASLNSSVRPQ